MFLTVTNTDLPAWRTSRCDPTVQHLRQMTRRLSLSHPTSTGSTTRRCKLKPTHLDTSTRNDEKTVKALAMHTSQGKHSPSSRPRLASTPLDTSNISIVLQKGGDTYLAPRHLARPTSLQGGNTHSPHSPTLTCLPACSTSRCDPDSPPPPNDAFSISKTRRGKGKPTDLDGSTRNNEHAVKALGMTTSLWEHSPESPPRLASTPPATSINTVFKWEDILTTYNGRNNGELLKDTVSTFPTVTNSDLPAYSTPQCDPHSPAPPPHDVLSAVSLYINRDSTTRRGKENPTYGDTNTRHNEHTICNKSISSAHKPVATLTSKQDSSRRGPAPKPASSMFNSQPTRSRRIALTLRRGGGDEAENPKRG
uniref:Uncharacterized protein n=1 Tax=Psilocybe cubensis TaxID=181762 RepID=A0A8H7XJP4_PSICU